MLNLPFIPGGYSAVPFGNGLINKTYKLTSDNQQKPAYLLQKINHSIFKDVEGLQRNIKLVTDHIRKKLTEQGVKDIERRVLTPVEFDDKSLFQKDGEGNYWRMFLFIENTISYERMETPQMAMVAGRAFGNFHKLLNDFPGETLCEVLPGFHNTPMRIESLRNRVKENPCLRYEEVKHEAEYLLGRADEFSRIVEMGRDGKLPLRVVHQDTKFNNVLLDAISAGAEPEVLCIIDLDTVMPGYICYDVGDAIRSGANKGKEDDRNLENVGLDFDIYKGFLKGFTEVTAGFLTPEELESLPFGPKLLTYEQAVRFLDDYLNGDNYYRVEYEKHNLIRARAQIRLLESMDSLITA